MGPSPTHLKPSGRPRLQGFQREAAFAQRAPGSACKARPGRDTVRCPCWSTGPALPGPGGRRPRPRAPHAWGHRGGATDPGTVVPARSRRKPRRSARHRRPRSVAGPPAERLSASHPVLWRHREEAFLTDTLQTDLLGRSLRLPHAERGAASRARRRRWASAAQARRLLPGRCRGGDGYLGNRGPPRTWAPACAPAAGLPPALGLKRGAQRRPRREGAVGCRLPGLHARGWDAVPAATGGRPGAAAGRGSGPGHGRGGHGTRLRGEQRHPDRARRRTCRGTAGSPTVCWGRRALPSRAWHSSWRQADKVGEIDDRRVRRAKQKNGSCEREAWEGRRFKQERQDRPPAEGTML